jgi:transposase-like protein
MSPRQITSRTGTLQLQLPQVREGGFHTDLFERYQRAEQALVVTLMEMVAGARLHPQGAADHRGTLRQGLQFGR